MNLLTKLFKPNATSYEKALDELWNLTDVELVKEWERLTHPDNPNYEHNVQRLELVHLKLACVLINRVKGVDDRRITCK